LGAAETPERGIDLHHGGGTSMGPQPWELRKPRRAAVHPIAMGDFNGAAALGAAETARASIAVVMSRYGCFCEPPIFLTPSSSVN